MTRSGLSPVRLAVFAAVAAFALSLSGDRTSAAGVPATIYGQDPLEVLELKVRPNVIVVLDSSGSMTANVKSTETNSGDHPRSKMYQAKQVLQSVVQNNQDKVSFQFLTYTQVGERLQNLQAGRNRFQYYTGTMPAPELTVRRAAGDPSFTITSLTSSGTTATATTSAAHGFVTGNRILIQGASPGGYNGYFTITVTSTTRFTYTLGGTLTSPATGTITIPSATERGFQSWQIIYPQWNTVYFEEDAATDAICAASLNVGTGTFYASGATLATDLAAAMNAAACTGTARANTYSVAYNGSTGQFVFSRTGTRNFRIVWGRTPNNIRAALAETSTSTSGWSATVSTDYPYILLYRTTGTGDIYSLPTPFSWGMGTRWSFTESAVTYYQIAASRLWNGETIRVDGNGAVCGIDFANATQTNPPSLNVTASCAGGSGGSATFSFAGESFGGNNVSCKGGLSRVPLIPCDLAMPPAATQISNIGPYIEPQLPFDGPTGVPRGYTENMDGSWSAATAVTQPSAKADGWTPLGTSLIDIKGLPDSTTAATYQSTGSGACLVQDTTTNEPCTDPTTQTCVLGGCVERNFSKFWNQGQAASVGPPQAYPLDPISGHLDPKEKTIVLFVTDGNDTCPDRRNEDCVDSDYNGVCECVDMTGNGACGDAGDVPFTGPSNGETDAAARRAAYYAERLYTPLVQGQPGSSVQTFMIGYGGAFSGTTPTRLNWIAWGGSGLGQGQPGQPDIPTTGTGCQSWGNGLLGDTSGVTTDLDGSGQTGTCAWNATAAQLTAQRARCTTCQDAFVAPDGATLASQLQSIIDQGASEGEFNAQQSITESVFEYVYKVTLPDGTVADAASPSTRYRGIVPTRFVSSFTLPGFRGHLRAYQSDGATPPNAVLMWDAGEKLTLQISTAISNPSTGCNSTGILGECLMKDLHGNATDATIAASTAKIKRRIYTTQGNGVFCGSYPSGSSTCTFNPTDLMDGTSPARVSLWPPSTTVSPNVLPSDYTRPGFFDAAMGFPADTPTAYPTNVSATYCSSKTMDQCWFDVLQRDYKACLGSNLPSGCTSTNVNTKMRAARREARDMTVAFLAGAAAIADGAGVKRTPSTGNPRSEILYTARSWALGDSELATVAVVTPPSLSEPAPFQDEYALFRDGTRQNGKNVDSGGTQIAQGFGLTQPDDDQTAPTGIDTRTALKPVMTVVYAPTNDMLHAFRAGPCLATGCTETGGEELWGFVPYDQLGAVRLRAAYEPQGRANHVYMLARGIRFADVFVPGTWSRTIGGVAKTGNGVWRRVLYFGRGIGGKYVTALDVTAPGPYTKRALETVGPIPLWNRGNPDTQNGLVGGSANGTAADATRYLGMGETWSIPTVAYLNETKDNPFYATSRYPNGIQFAIFMGSGYGNPSATVREGTTHYTLDALSGDVIAAVDVEDAAGPAGLGRSGLSYPNAIVANSVSFNRSSFLSVATKAFNVNPHPWSSVSYRVYVGDLYGRLWKFLTANPNEAIPAADLGADQPIGTAVALLAEDRDPGAPNKLTTIPNIFVTSGAERRASGPFRNFSLIDRGEDTVSGFTGVTTVVDGVTAFAPVETHFALTFAQGEPARDCGLTQEAVFRGTIQPTSAVECVGGLDEGGACQGALLQRVFYGGTRLSIPNTRFAPPTPLACGQGCTQDPQTLETVCSAYPCRSQFDSILYAVGVQQGEAAYDLNSSTDDAYRIFRDSRIAAISFQADPDPAGGGSSFTADEGLIKGVPKPPPPPGVPPTTTSATASVVLRRDPGQPAPVVQYGSTVCQ